MFKLDFKNYLIEALLQEVSFNWTDPITGKTYPAMQAPLNSVKLSNFGTGFGYQFKSKEYDIDHSDNYEVQFENFGRRLSAEIAKVFLAKLSIDKDSDLSKKIIDIFLNNLKSIFKLDLYSEKSNFTPKFGKFEESDPLFVYANVIVATRKVIEEKNPDAFWISPSDQDPSLISIYDRFYKYYLHTQYVFVGSDFYINKEKIDSIIRDSRKIDQSLPDKLIKAIQDVDLEKKSFVSKIRKFKMYNKNKTS